MFNAVFKQFLLSMLRVLPAMFQSVIACTGNTKHTLVIHRLLCAVIVGLSCTIMVQYVCWRITIVLITNTVNKSTINSTEYSNFGQK